MNQVSQVESYLGHKGRCFDVRVSAAHFISASEDGTAKVWSVHTRKCEITFSHNKNSEVLRACFLGELCCTGGSDGKVSIWKRHSSSSSNKLVRLNSFSHRNGESQVYACEPLTDLKLITAADDQMYLWDVESNNCSIPEQCWHFSALTDDSVHNNFGGPRNMNNEVYVFDAKVNPSNRTSVAVALSDASIRLLDIRQPQASAVHCVISINSNTQPNYNNVNFGHATAIGWSSDSTTILVSFGSGNVAIVDTKMNTIRGLLSAHNSACYGTTFLDDSSCISWSSDCTVKKWDVSSVSGICNTPTSTVTVQKDFPVFCCAVVPDTGSILCGGGSGGSGNSFLGTPIYQIKPFS